MEILIINFSLEGITDDSYAELCDQVAPAFATVDGLLSKVWLADASSNRYGGVYAFASEADVEAFLASQLFADVAAHPNLVDADVRRFHVMDEPTRVTRGLEAARA